MKFLLALFFIFVGAQANAACTAPCTQSQLLTDINTNWADNTNNRITPALLRGPVTEIVNTYFALLSQFQIPLNSIAVGRGAVNGFNSATVSSPLVLSGGTLSCPTCGGGGGGGTPGGSTTQLQYNNSGSFGGVTGATSNGTTLTLVAPILGTPASVNLSNATALPLSTGITGTLADGNLSSNVALKSSSNAFTNSNLFSGSTTWTGNLIIPIRTITAAGAITVSATSDYFICVNKTTGAATTVNLPSSPATGQTYLVKDCKGDAATNNITVTPASGTIDGSATYVINVNRASVATTWNGSAWQLN